MSSINSAVHFRGRDMAIQAFANRKVKAWAIFNNRQFLASHIAENADDAANALDEFLSMMDQPGNIAVYTVKVYEDLKVGEKIKSNTADDGSFNFRLSDPVGNQQGIAGTTSAGNYEMMQLLKKMDARIDELEKPIEADPDPEPKNFIGQIKDFLEIPGMQAIISGLVQKVTGAPSQALGYAPNAVPGAATTGSDTQSEYDANVNEYTAVIDAYNVIKNSGMPDALQLLQRLAQIAATDQEKFRSLQAAIKMFL